jgi:MFS transporter, OFA family, oxalate/formate antiporter
VYCARPAGLISAAQTLTEFYTFYAVAGMGNSFVYCGSIAVALKWFPDKRGLAFGLIAGGYSSGAAVFYPDLFLAHALVGYRSTYVWTGIGIGIIILLTGQFLRHASEGFLATVTLPVKQRLRRQGGEEFTSREIARTPQFYALDVIAAGVRWGIDGRRSAGSH